jgi:multisubunit Na+/H+ antiporter MnhB subunit
MTTVLTQVVARLLFLPSLLIAIGVMIKGYADTGDGFSAGVIAALGVGLQLIAFGAHELERLPILRYAPIGTFVGLFLALLTAFVPAIRGDILFTHWPPAGEDVIHFGTLELLTAVAFDIGVFLIVFGFGVGVIGALARAEARMFRADTSSRVVVRDHVQTGGGG